MQGMHKITVFMKSQKQSPTKMLRSKLENKLSPIGAKLFVVGLDACCYMFIYMSTALYEIMLLSWLFLILVETAALGIFAYGLKSGYHSSQAKNVNMGMYFLHFLLLFLKLLLKQTILLIQLMCCLK